MAARFPLRLLPGRYAVVRLASDQAVPAWAMPAGADLSCVVRTREELSILRPEAGLPDGVQAERGFRAFQLVGPVPFTTTGVIAGLTKPLAEQGLSVFVVSTYDTDYLLVKESTLAAARACLVGAGFVVHG